MQPEPRLARMREEGAVPPSVDTCAACHRFRSIGSSNKDADIFICVQCEAGADQLFAIQDAIWPAADVATESTSGAATPAQP